MKDDIMKVLGYIILMTLSICGLVVMLPALLIFAVLYLHNVIYTAVTGKKIKKIIL